MARDRRRWNGNMMVRLAMLLGLLAAVVSCGGLLAVVYAQTLPAQDLLNPDGTLNLETGISGCVDVSGYQVRLDAERGPVFVPLAGATADIGQAGTSALSGSQPQRGPLAPMAAGEAWSPLGTGMNDPVLAIAVKNGTLYAGGIFTTAGGVPANRIATWDGTAWSPLGAGMDGAFVHAIAVSNGTLYAGGVFTQAGGVANTKHIAKWEDGAWSALGTGVDYWVSAIAVSNGTLYAGGTFHNAGEVPANHIAKWEDVAFTKGDVNGDGSIDVIDVRLCLQIAQGYITGTPQQRAAADVDGDGNVDETDAQILSEYIIGMRTTLP